jgi:hypothetical protein
VNVRTARIVERSLPWLALVASAVAQPLRRPDLFLRPQFFAEDGLFFAQAHNQGLLGTLFEQSNGYLQLLPRLAASAAQVVPLAWSPAFMLAVAVGVNALPAAFVVSDRMRSAIPSVWARVLLAALYIALPGTNHAASVVTYSQWHLSIVALMVLLAEAPTTRIGHAFDAAVVVLSGLSGPYSILLAPVAVVHWYLRPSVRTGLLGGALAVTGVAQALTMLSVGLEARTASPRGATPLLFLRIVGGRIFYGATAGHELQAVSLPLWPSSLGSDRFISAAGAVGLVLVALAFWRGTHELRMLLAYATAIVAAVLVTASTAVGGPPQWVVLVNQDALPTYFIVPILAVYAMCVWMLSERARAWRTAGAIVLALAAIFGIPHDWRELPVEDADYPASVEAYEAAPAGSSVRVPIPPSWSIELVKLAPDS